MKAISLFTIFMLLIIGAIVYWGIIPYTSIGNPNNSFLHWISSLEILQHKDYTNAAMEVEKQRILQEHDGQMSDMSDEEKHKVLYKEYAEANDMPEFAYGVTLLLIVTGFSAIWCGCQASMSISLILCLILLFFSWKLIALAVLIDVVFIPMLMCGAVKGLFSK